MEALDRVLITGATGFVGSAVARLLVERGFAVRAMIRPGSPTFHLAGLPLDFVPGELRDAASVRNAMIGVRWLFHVAADYRLWAPDPAELAATNVTGTRTVMEEAMRAGVERVVYTSSAATLAPRPDRSPADETIPLSADKAIGAYRRTKIQAERMVEALLPQGLRAIIVNPS